MTIDVLKQIWPEWQIEGKPLGKGSYGVVYKAVRRDHNVESYAAIKVISIPTDSSEVDSLRSEGLDINATKTYLNGIVNDFVSEIQLMESLKGVQNIVSVEDYKVVEKVDEVGWDIYIRMELLTPFNTYICDKNLTENDVIKLGCDICTALEICNKRNVIHRDIKPENIFINDFGDFKLGDFGIARKMENMTSGLSQKGTFNYMAPEVANSNDYDARVDIYSLGIVMYRLLNGNRLPFLDTEKQLLNPNERRNAVDRRLRGEKLPVPCNASSVMADIILRACDYDPNMRFASAAEMKQALMSAANGTYKISTANDPNRTLSVHKAPTDYDKTTSVRKVPAANNQISGQIGTFGNATKKNHFPKIIATVLAATVLMGIGIFVVPKLINRNSEGGLSDNIVTTTSAVAGYSKLDEEKIASIITEAEALAAAEDYEGALKKVQTGLATYPKSEDLQEKSAKYTTALNAQIKETTIADAQKLADSGDYKAAMSLIQKAIDTYGEDADYKNVYIIYSQAHITSVKAEAITNAENLVVSGEYLDAIRTIEAAITEIGEDSELTDKVDQYTKTYITSTVNDAKAMSQKKEYADALSILDEALKHYPDNEALKQTVSEVEKEKKAANSTTAGNPNQNPVLPKTPEEHNITGATNKANALTIQREDIYHSSFTDKGEIEWYKFTTSNNYSAYSIQILNNSINTTVYVTIYDVYDNELGQQAIGKGDTNYLDLALESNSEYWMKVHRYYDDRMGNYQFAINEKICDAGIAEVDSFYVDLDIKYTKALDVRGFNDWYKFTSTGNYSTYQFSLTNNSINTTLYLTVYDEYGTELGSTSASKGSSSILDLRLSANKEYTVCFSRYYNDRNGNYQFCISEMVCDAGLSQEEAFPFEVNKILYGTADTSFEEWFVCTFPVSSKYTLKLTNNSINTTLYATVYDVLDTELGTISASKGDNSEISLDVVAGTTLYIKITRYYSDRFGNYTLYVS